MHPPPCPFCDVQPETVFLENPLAIALFDRFPVTPLHMLVVPRRHEPDCFELRDEELDACRALLAEARRAVLGKDASVTGFNIGFNCGRDAGQSIFHCHIHLIPRRRGDVENPKGGVRGVIPSKQSY